MTSSSAPQSKSSTKLSDAARQLTLTAANIVYDPQGVEMIRTALENTKNAQAIAPTVAMLATTLLHKMGGKVSELPEEELWGKMGVVHSILGTIFEVASVLGYPAPESDLKVAYEIVDDQMEAQARQSAAPQGAPPEMADPGMMGGAMPQQEMGPPQGGFPAAQMGGM
jgi:hypothetical protein